MRNKEPLIDLLIHDLTGPLSIVSSSTRGLLNKDDPGSPMSPRQRQVMERILRNATKAQNLLHEMIEVYRSDEGLFRRDSFLVEEVVKGSLLDATEIMDLPMAPELSCAVTMEEFLKVLNAYGIYVVITGRYCASPFTHDQKKIQQILRNLITNALKYRRKRLTLSLCGDNDLIITVEDDGAGIPKDKQKHVFKRFFGLNHKGENSVGGLGFGLSCVKAMVETMEGDITLTSGEGQGTSFVVRIPPLKM